MSSKAQAVLATIQKLEFPAEILISSRYPDNSEVFHLFLLFVESVKFYYRLKKLMGNRTQIYVEGGIPKQSNSPRSGPVLPTDVISTQTQLKSLLQSLKNKLYQKHQYNEGVLERTSTGKVISLQGNYPVPANLEPTKISSRQMVGQMIHLLKPLVYIFLYWVFKEKSYKSWVIPIVMELVRLGLQKNIKCRSVWEKSELDERKREMIIKSLFRNPFFGNIFKPRILLPLLGKVFARDGFIMKVIMYFVEMRSSLSLTV